MTAIAITFIRLAAVFLMVGLGTLARRRAWLDSESTRRIALVLTNVFYPALIYSTVVSGFTLRSLADNWLLPAGAFGIMLIGFAVGLAAGRLVPFASDRQRRGFRFQCTMNNYVFLPMPLVLLYWGQPGVAALVFSTIGSEIAVWTLGILSLTGQRPDLQGLRRLLSLPMAAIVAAITTLVLTAGQQPQAAADTSLLSAATAALMSAMDIVGKGTIPCAMLVAGSRMAELRWHHLRSPVPWVLVALRLVVIPGLAIALLRLLPLPDISFRVLALVAVMPSAVASVVLSEIYQADTEFAATGVLATHLVSLVTIPLWLSLCL